MHTKYEFNTAMVKQMCVPNDPVMELRFHPEIHANHPVVQLFNLFQQIDPETITYAEITIKIDVGAKVPKGWDVV